MVAALWPLDPEDCGVNDLPPCEKLGRKDAFYSLILAPLEYITKSLSTGDGWELLELEQVVRRCRALVAAYDKRMEAHKND